MQRPTVILCILLLSFTSFGQEIDLKTGHKNSYKKAIYLGVGGTNIIGGLNFDFRFNPNVISGWGMHLGVGYGDISDLYHGYKFTTLSLGINKVSQSTRHHVVYGIGLMPTMAKYSSSNNYQETNLRFGAYFEAGYRYQSPDNGLFVQLSWTPFVIVKEFAGFLWGGLGIGYTFW